MQTILISDRNSGDIFQLANSQPTQVGNSSRNGLTLKNNTPYDK